jgi:transcriptional regulator with XRE-family HTH domain
MLQIAIKLLSLLKLETMTKENKYLEKLGKRIAELRKAKGHTQEEFATLTKLNRAALARLEKEPINLTMKTLLKISKALEIEVHELVNVND